MILIAGIPTESPVRLAIESADRAGVDYVVVNQRDSARLELSLRVSGNAVSGELRTPERTVDLDQVTGIYWRLMQAERLPEASAQVAAAARDRVLATNRLLVDWVEAADARIANRIGPMCSNGSKPYQALAIEAAGFAVPDTLVSTDPAQVQAARDRWGPTIYKSTSSVRSIVRTLGPSEELGAIGALPTQFQRSLPGTDIRVHVVGDAVHATRIESAAVDYRYAGRDGLDAKLTAYELPAEVGQRCRLLSRRLDLPFCGIDLRVSPDGEWSCFEVNPSPGYSYYQASTGQPISDSLVRWLAA